MKHLTHQHSKRLQAIFQISSWIGIGLTIVLGMLCYKMGLLTDVSKLRQLISHLGSAGPFVFVLLQIIQVVIPIIPGGVSTAAGVLLFGGLWGFIWNYIGISLGSLIAFWIAKIYGRPLIHAIFKPATIERYEKWTGQDSQFTKLFALAIFFPIAPDDFLCYLAGTTPMTYRTFTWIILLGKPASILIYSLGLSQLIHFFG